MELLPLAKNQNLRPTHQETAPNPRLRRTNLAISLPPRDRSLAVPLPIPLSAASSSSSSSINPSDLVGIGILGRGNSGTVHLVCHYVTAQHYALKIIQGRHEDSISSHISREIEIFRTTNSPFVVSCHGLFHQGGEIQIFLEYMDGGTLDSLSPILERILAKIASQILHGLAYLHRQKIVHNDIKPKNILINGQGQVKISDFGVIRYLAGTTDSCSSSAGTIAYMSPERISNQRSYYDGYASDIWSFGMSVLECYLGSFPITHEEVDWVCMVNEIKFKKPPEAPARSSEDFKSFIKCCLQKQPSDRWKAVQLLEHPFIKRAERKTRTSIDQHSPASASSSNAPIRHLPLLLTLLFGWAPHQKRGLR